MIDFVMLAIVAFIIGMIASIGYDFRDQLKNIKWGLWIFRLELFIIWVLLVKITSELIK